MENDKTIRLFAFLDETTDAVREFAEKMRKLLVE